MRTGTIKSLSDKKFGLITPDDIGTKDLFFHQSSLVDVMFEDLAEGHRVIFEVEESDKGPRASSVTRVP